MKKNSKNKIIVLALLIIAFLVSHTLLSIVGVPTFPVVSTETPSQITCPTQGGYVLNHDSIGSGVYIYNITHAEPMNSSCGEVELPAPAYGATELVSFNVYLPQNYSNSTQINYAIKQNNAELNQTSIGILVCPDEFSYSTCYIGNPTYYQIVTNGSYINHVLTIYNFYVPSSQKATVGYQLDQIENVQRDAEILVYSNQYITSHIIQPTPTTNTTTSTSNTLTSNSTKTITPSTQSPTIPQPPIPSNVFSKFFSNIMNAIMNFLKTYFGI